MRGRAIGSAKDYRRIREVMDLLRRDHTPNGGILFALEGHIVEIQARAMEFLGRPLPWRAAANVGARIPSAGAEYDTTSHATRGRPRDQRSARERGSRKGRVDPGPSDHP